MDDPVQPGAERASRVHLRAGRDDARPPRARRRAGGAVPRPLQARGPGGRDGQGHGARAHRLPPPVLRSCLARLPRRLRDGRGRHRPRAQLARVRRRGLPLLPPLRHEGRGHAEPGDGRRSLRREPAVLRRHEDLGREPEGRREDPRGGCALPRREVHAQLHALLAAQDPSDLSRDHAVVRGHGRRARLRGSEACAVAALARARGHRGHGVLPAVGQVAPLQHDRQPARLDAVPAAPVGRADGLLRAPGDRRAASAHRRDPRAGCEARGAGRHRGLAGSHRRGDARRRGRPRVREGARHARRVVRLGQHAPDGDGRPGRPSHRCGLACSGHRVPRRPLPRRFRPAPRLVPLVAARVVHAERPAAVQGPADPRLHRGRRRQEDVEVEGQRRRAAEGVRDAGRGGPALVGGRHRLLRRSLDLRRDPEARRRELPAAAQHAALPDGEHGRLRSRARRGAGRRAGRGRPLRARAARRPCAGRGRRLRPLRVPPGGEATHDLRLRGPRRLLPRRAEGPPLHDRGGKPRAPLGADGARDHPRRVAEAPRADPLVHRRGSVAHPPPAGPDDLRPHLVRTSSPPFPTRASWCRSGSGSSRCAPRCCASSSSCACRVGSARRCRPT